MKTEQVNIRLEAQLLSTIQAAADEEHLERGTMIRKLMLMGLRQYRLDRTLADYQALRISIGYAAQELDLSVSEMLDLARSRGIGYPLDPGGYERSLRQSVEDLPAVAERATPYAQSGARSSGRVRAKVAFTTLPDRPPQTGGVLLVGINPALVSARAGHYYQGKLGRRMWGRLARLGLLAGEAVPGREDDAFVAAGNGLTDVVKRASTSAEALSKGELRMGAEEVRGKIATWRPGVVVFVYRQAAVAVSGNSAVRPGAGPEVAGAPTFLLAGPYAAREEVEENADSLRAMLAPGGKHTEPDLWTQRITKKDLAAGRIRLPRPAKALFGTNRTRVSIVLRSKRLEVAYDPGTSGDRERSAVLRVGRDELSRLVQPDERLRLKRARDGSVRID